MILGHRYPHVVLRQPLVRSRRLDPALLAISVAGLVVGAALAGGVL